MLFLIRITNRYNSSSTQSRSRCVAFVTSKLNYASRERAQRVQIENPLIISRKSLWGKMCRCYWLLSKINTTDVVTGW